MNLLAMPLTSRRYKGTEAVTLYVGHRQTAFCIYKDYLCERSAFFKAAFNSKSKEGAELTMTLPDEKVRNFKRFVDWLYIPPFLHQPEDARDVRLDHLIGLYILADKYDIPELEKYVCDRIFDYANNRDQFKAFTPWPDIKEISMVYKQLPPNAGLRKLFVDWFARGLWPVGFGPWRTDEEKAWLMKNPEIAADLVGALIERHCESTKYRKPFPEEIQSKYYGTVGDAGDETR